MKICYVTSGSENVGTYFRALFWAKYLVKHGHTVTLISSHEKPDWNLKKNRFRDGINVITFIKSPYRFDYIGFLIRPILVFFHVIFNHYDVVHSFVCWQPPSAVSMMAVRLKRVFGGKTKLIADWDDLWGEGGIAKEHGTLLSGIITIFEKSFPKFADHVTVCGEFLKKKAIIAGIQKKKISVIYNGSNVDDIKPLLKHQSRNRLHLPKNAKLVLYIGQFQTSVFLQLIKAMDLIIKNDKDINFYILGHLSHEYEKIAQQRARQIKYLGKIKYEQLSMYMSASDLLLLPMEESDVERARFPIRFGDYIASGTPILSSPQGEIKHLIETYRIAYIADINNPVQFADTLVRVLAKHNGIGKKARIFAENELSWNTIVNKIEKMYEKI